MMIFTKQRTLDILRCRIGLHDFQVEYRSAPAAFTVGDKEVQISGTVERCQRPGCGKLYFTYNDWPRLECYPQARERRYSASERESRVLVLA